MVCYMGLGISLYFREFSAEFACITVVFPCTSNGLRWVLGGFRRHFRKSQGILASLGGVTGSFSGGFGGYRVRYMASDDVFGGISGTSSDSNEIRRRYRRYRDFEDAHETALHGD